MKKPKVQKSVYDKLIVMQNLVDLIIGFRLEILWISFLHIMIEIFFELDFYIYYDSVKSLGIVSKSRFWHQVNLSELIDFQSP